MNSQQREALKTELQDVKYSGKTDQECFDMLNAVNITVPQSINVLDIQRYLALNDKLLTLESSAELSAKKAVRVMELFESFDMTDTVIATKITDTLTSLVTSVLINETDKTAILAMGEKQVSRAEQLELGKVRLGYIVEARQ